MTTKIIFCGGPADGLTAETFHKIKSLPPTMAPPLPKPPQGGLYIRDVVGSTPVQYVWKPVQQKR